MFYSTLRDLTDLASGKFQRDSYSAEIDESKKKNFVRRGPYIDCIRIIFFVIPHLVDPLFFYIPVINDDKKCLALLWPFWEMAVMLRSIHDIFHMIIILSLQLDYLCNTSGLRHEGENSHKDNLLIDFLIALPVPQVFGGLWYFMAIERETECWKKACINYTRRHPCIFYCPGGLANDTCLSKFFPTTTRNTAIHDFGIFYDALESGIVEGTEFPPKFYIVFYGVFKISGQNLETSRNVQENIFAISVVISSLLLFVLVLGNMQMYLQSITVRLMEKTPKAREIEWLPFQKLFNNLLDDVKNYQRYTWRKTKDIDLENLLNNLPKELRRKLKRELLLGAAK